MDLRKCDHVESITRLSDVAVLVLVNTFKKIAAICHAVMYALIDCFSLYMLRNTYII